MFSNAFPGNLKMSKSTSYQPDYINESDKVDYIWRVCLQKQITKKKIFQKSSFLLCDHVFIVLAVFFCYFLT